MTENRYAKVLTDSHIQYGILDRNTGRVQLIKNISSLDIRYNYLVSGDMSHEDFSWTEDVVVIAELGPVPEIIGGEFEAYSLFDEDEDSITVERAVGTSIPGTYLVTSPDGVFIETEKVPELLSAIARSAGLDPETY